VSRPTELRHFAERCRKMASTEQDPRIKGKLLEMADEYERRADAA
jgi:hypothetical protein